MWPFLKRGIEIHSYGMGERIASMLLAMSKEYGEKIGFRLTNDEIAELVGCSAVTVSKTLSKLMKRGLISRNSQW